MSTSFLQSSGNLAADRRYAFGQELATRGDCSAAADLFAQAIELTPEFTAAWFALGEMRARLGQTAQAIAAFERVCALDPHDHHGAQLHLVRLGARAPDHMPPAYVRMLFDQYAERFDAALTEGLAYRAPRLLVEAVTGACAIGGHAPRFRTTLDLGCGTGLGGAAFRPLTDRLVGVDLSPRMIDEARTKNLYDRLVVADILQFLAAEREERFDLIFAADVFAYFPDLRPLLRAAAEALEGDGVLAFTVETHGGDGVILSEKLRYAHGAPHVRSALAAAGCEILAMAEGSSRREAGIPVPGLVIVAQKR